MISPIVRCSLMTLLAMQVLAAAAPAAHADGLRAEQAWIRQPAPSRDLTAAYVNLVNPSDAEIRVVSARSPLARTVELHEMVMEKDRMRMRKLSSVVVPARGRVELRPGGAHAMLFGLTRKLQPGDRVPIVFTLASGGEVRAEALVRAPGEGP